MPTFPEMPAASATTDESELAVIYKNGTTYKAVLADILALRQQANAILTSLSGLGAGVGFLQKTGPTSFVTTYIPGAGAYDPLGTAQAINDAHNLDAGAHAAAGFAKLGVAQTWTAAQRFADGSAAAPSVAIGESGTGLFQVSAGVLGISLSGVARVQVTGSSVTHNQNDAALGVGGVVGVGSGYEVFSPDSGNALNTLTTFGGSAQLIMRKANGTGAAPAASSVGSVFGQVGFRGYGASGWATGNRAYLVATATENWTDSAQGCRMSIYSTPTGSTTASETFRFDAGGSTLYTALNVRAANALRVETAAGQDAVAIVGRAGGSGSYAVTLTPPALAGNVTVTLPTVACSLAGFNVAQTWTAAQTFRAANAIRVEAASTQDAIILAGRAGGTGSYAVTLTPPTLAGNVTVTLPTVTGSLACFNVGQTWTAAQTFRAANAIRVEAASTQDAIVLAGRAGGTSSYAVTLAPTTLTANRTLTLPDADITLPATFVSLSDSNLWTSTQNFRTAGGIRTESAAGKDALIVVGSNNGTSSYAVALTPAALGGNHTVTIPNETFTIPSPSLNQTWTGAHLFRSSDGIRVEVAANQDAIVIAGRTGGTSSREITLTPAILSADVTQTLISVTGDIPVKTAVPATAASAGVIGQIAFDATYAYFCYAVNTWRRVAIASW